MAAPKLYTVNEPEQLLIAEPLHPDYLKLLTCLKIFGAALFIAAVLYALTSDKNIAVGIVGSSYIVLTLFHTPFGLIGLFAFLALENIFTLRPDFSYSKLLGIIIFASYVLHIFHLKVVLGTPQKLMLAICAWSWASLLWTVAPSTSWQVLTTYSLYFGMCFIALSALRDKNSFYVVIAGFVFGSIVASAMLQFGQVQYASYSQEMMGRALLTGEDSPVIVGRAIAFGFIITCSVFFTRSKHLKKLAVALLVLFFLVLVTKTQSRMSLITAIGAPVLSIILYSGGKKRIQQFCIAVLLLGVAYFAVNLIVKSDLMSERGAERFMGEGLEESGRLRMWSEGVRLTMRRPLHGFGIGASPMAREDRGKGASLHSNYVAIPADMGLIGLGLYVLLVFVLYRQTKKIADTRLKFIGMGMILYACMSGITSVTYGFKDFWYAITIALLCITLDRRNAPKKPEVVKNQKKPPDPGL